MRILGVLLSDVCLQFEMHAVLPIAGSSLVISEKAYIHVVPSPLVISGREMMDKEIVLDEGDDEMVKKMKKTSDTHTRSAEAAWQPRREP